MTDNIKMEMSELHVLHQEYEWLLTEELPRCYSQLKHVLEESIRLFPECDDNHNGAPPKSEKFIMAATPHTTNDHVKAVVTVAGDTITQAEINVRLGAGDGKRGGGGGGSASGGGSGGGSGSGSGGATGGVQRTTVTADTPWRLQQMQDAHNYLKQALLRVTLNYATPKSCAGTLAELGAVISALQSSRQCLLVPRRKTIDELLASPNVRALQPPLNSDTALSFYVQGHKLVLAVYQVGCSTGSVRFESVQAECAVPWLSTALATLTSALHLAHAIRDKIQVFTQYKDFNPDTLSVSTMSC